MSWLIWPKGCQKCAGDLTSGSDAYGSYLSCLQCGTITHEAMKPRFVCAVPERKAVHRLVSTPDARSEGRHPTRAASPLVRSSPGTRYQPQNGDGAQR